MIQRSVDLGQTVAASLQAPVLFKIAQDMSQIQIEAKVDEADIGAIKPEDPATFTVDAFPDQSFQGRVAQVRLAATTSQNVVTYSVMVQAPNSPVLLPGMTANVRIVTNRRDDVLRVPNDAARFQPAGTGQASAPGQRWDCRRARRSGRPWWSRRPRRLPERTTQGTGPDEGAGREAREGPRGAVRADARAEPGWWPRRTGRQAASPGGRPGRWWIQLQQQPGQASAIASTT